MEKQLCCLNHWANKANLRLRNYMKICCVHKGEIQWSAYMFPKFMVITGKKNFNSIFNKYKQKKSFLRLRA